MAFVAPPCTLGWAPRVVRRAAAAPAPPSAAGWQRRRAAAAAAPTQRQGEAEEAQGALLPTTATPPLRPTRPAARQQEAQEKQQQEQELLQEPLFSIDSDADLGAAELPSKPQWRSGSGNGGPPHVTPAAQFSSVPVTMAGQQYASLLDLRAHMRALQRQLLGEADEVEVPRGSPAFDTIQVRGGSLQTSGSAHGGDRRRGACRAATAQHRPGRRPLRPRRRCSAGTPTTVARCGSRLSHSLWCATLRPQTGERAGTGGGVGELVACVPPVVAAWLPPVPSSLQTPPTYPALMLSCLHYTAAGATAASFSL